ncbi:MAG: hypothetical protein JSS04_06510 [Proteobacteria bacterium]|nr:hypothetical protein [Pseudomonadota bacterium]
MRIVAACLTVPFALVGAAALAQAAGDPLDKLRACSALASAERTECLDKLAREIAPSDRPAATSTAAAPVATDRWVVSETTSPLDYSPVVIATAVATSNVKLSIACRSGSTSLVVDAPAFTPGNDPPVVSYVVNDAQPVVVASKPAAAGIGTAVAVDVVHLLMSLPAQGEIAFRINGRQDPQSPRIEGRYSLAGLKALREKLAVACKWQFDPVAARKQ